MGSSGVWLMVHKELKKTWMHNYGVEDQNATMSSAHISLLQYTTDTKSLQIKQQQQGR